MPSPAHRTEERSPTIGWGQAWQRGRTERRSRPLRPRRLPLLFLALLLIPSAAFSTHAGVVVQSRIDTGPWRSEAAIYPRKGQKVTLRVEAAPGSTVRWYRIYPDISRFYKNANHPWEKDPYRWIGLARIDYHREELTGRRGRREMEVFDGKGQAVRDDAPWWRALLGAHPADAPFARNDLGSFWFQVEVDAQGRTLRSPGVEADDRPGLSPGAFRISVGEGEGLLRHLSTFFNVPGLFGSLPWQSSQYLGADCADVLMAAYDRWTERPSGKDYNVAMLVSRFSRVAELDLSGGDPARGLRWETQVRPGDLIAVRYPGRKQYQHIGALYEDANRNGLLDRPDLVLHAGPDALHASRLAEGGFDGHAVVLRPQ